MKDSEDLYYPCIADSSGRIRKVVGNKMTREQAEDFLKYCYREEWLKVEAIPQLVRMIDR